MRPERTVRAPINRFCYLIESLERGSLDFNPHLWQSIGNCTSCDRRWRFVFRAARSAYAKTAGDALTFCTDCLQIARSRLGLAYAPVHFNSRAGWLTGARHGESSGLSWRIGGRVPLPPVCIIRRPATVAAATAAREKRKQSIERDFFHQRAHTSELCSSFSIFFQLASYTAYSDTCLWEILLDCDRQEIRYRDSVDKYMQRQSSCSPAGANESHLCAKNILPGKCPL